MPLRRSTRACSARVRTRPNSVDSLITPRAWTQARTHHEKTAYHRLEDKLRTIKKARRDSEPASLSMDASAADKPPDFVLKLLMMFSVGSARTSHRLKCASQDVPEFARWQAGTIIVTAPRHAVDELVRSTRGVASLTQPSQDVLKKYFRSESSPHSNDSSRMWVSSARSRTRLCRRSSVSESPFAKAPMASATTSTSTFSASRRKRSSRFDAPDAESHCFR